MKKAFAVTLLSLVSLFSNAETESFDYSVAKALQIKDQILLSTEINGVVDVISSTRKVKCSIKDVYSVSYKFEQLDEDNSQIMLFDAIVPCLAGKIQLPIKISGQVFEDQNLNLILIPLSYQLY